VPLSQLEDLSSPLSSSRIERQAPQLKFIDDWLHVAEVRSHLINSRHWTGHPRRRSGKVNTGRPVRIYPGGERYFTSGCPVHQQRDRRGGAVQHRVTGSAPSGAMSSYCGPCYAFTPPAKMCVGKSTTGAPGAPARSSYRRPDSVVAM
jgi:hypothetical protein